jgi:hypothetical protein
VADQVWLREDFTERHREHHIWHFHQRAHAWRKHLSTLSTHSKLQQRDTTSECSETADPEGEDYSDLLGEEAAGVSIRWSL